MASRAGLSRFTKALPFWMSLALIPLAWISAIHGGWTILLLPLGAWQLFALIDMIAGLNTENADPATKDEDLFWYRLITLVWAPIQFCTIFGILWYVTATGHLSSWEKAGVFLGIGVISGTIGINYAHELMHQRPKWERSLGDLLLAMVLYSHFRSEHLLVHHIHVATPRDPVTAQNNEGFHRFFPRVLRQSLSSSFQAEGAMLARKGKGWSDRANPFWLYAALQGVMIVLAGIIGGWAGIGLFMLQAFIAIWQLELVNYVEHYGLTRRRLPNGKYEHVQPHHSWNASHRATNWLLINLQRHSDHHYKPDRRFPLLQTYTLEQAPQLPFSYPVMTVAAMIPPLWRRVMNPRVRRWRKTYYPDIAHWPRTASQSPLPAPQIS